MKTEEALQNGIKELSLSIPVDKISVTNLCEHCGINRQTFYYHYRDIYDLVQSIFLEKSQEFINSGTVWDDAAKELFEFIEKNRVYIKILMKSNLSSILKDFFYDIIYVKLMHAYRNSNSMSGIDQEDARLISRFFASAFASELCYYIEHEEKYNTDEMIRKFHIFAKGPVALAAKNASGEYKKK